MDLARVSKAIAGGLATAGGGSATAYFMIPEGLAIPQWVYFAVPVVNFIAGFLITYVAPANAP